MKNILVDFEGKSAIATTLTMVLTGAKSEVTEESADVVLVNSPTKVLHYLQNTDKKLVQVAFAPHHPMSHLVEDYPDRFRVVAIENSENSLVAICQAMSELVC
jgi:hypothetical protein